MKKLLLGSVALAALGAAGVANAAEMPVRTAPLPLWSWTGWYIGGHAGGAFDRSEIDHPYGATLFGDEVRSPGGFVGGQVGYNWQVGSTVYGLEADASFADLDGTFTCLQAVRGSPFPANFVGGFFGATCQTRVNAFGTLAARLGSTIGSDSRTLVYAKGGGAWVHKRIDVAVNNANAGFPDFGPPNAITTSRYTQWGWTAGRSVPELNTP